MDWIEIIESFDNPIRGATAIVKTSPDVVFLDVEMPHVDGEYLVDWIKPQLDAMKDPPKIIVISSLSEPPRELLKNATGFINKYSITDPEVLESRLKKILFWRSR